MVKSMIEIEICDSNGMILGYSNKRTAFISTLYVHSKYRNKGMGTKLMKLFCENVIKHGCIHIELDDMSDCQRQRNNFYIKSGFKYKSKYGPEMVGNTRNVIRFATHRLKKYVV